MKCIFIDIDGTLYDHKNNVVLDSSIEAIKLTREKGNKVFICTGRSLSESKKFLNYDVDGFIFCAGTVVYVEKNRIYKNPFDINEIKRIITGLEKLNLGYCLDGDAGAYCNASGFEFVKKYFNQTSDEAAVYHANDNGFFTIDLWDERDDICKMCVYGKNQQELEMADDLLKRYTLTTTLKDKKKELFCKEITLNNHNKSLAAKMVLNHYGLDYEDAVGIGDSDNDYELIRDCGIGIAMGNAHDLEKTIADYITDDVSDHGIYNAFKKFNLI